MEELRVEKITLELEIQDCRKYKEMYGNAENDIKALKEKILILQT